MELPQTSEEVSPSPPDLMTEPVVTSRSLVDLIWQLRWQSASVRHTEELFTRLNVWRDLDLCPAPLVRALPGRKPRDTLDHRFGPGDLFEAYDPNQCRDFSLRSFAQGQLVPRLGRFYPQGLLREFPFSIHLYRCTGLTGTDLQADLNHPLAGHSLDLSVTVTDIRRKKGETGGQCQEWLGVLTDGPGLQSRWQGRPTDFFSPDAFERPDDRPDTGFYAQPRLVSHIDRQARETISRLYGRLLRPGMRVLDLMGSWQSHLPATVEPLEVVGLGLNEAELRQNPQLAGYLVHDLNLEPSVPWSGESFDAVICTVSVEYLTRPFDVFADILRLLKPNGLFILTFSNRWFPPKVVKIWTELLDFERLGLVLEYFHRTGGFKDLETHSARGWPRPQDDAYFPQVRFADPVFAVWGRRAG
jgi:SAM-dependent methyltransferase